jgi:hypothetical protein
VQLLRHETSLGIVASKNASLSALMDAGCEHLFYGMMMPGPSPITGTSLHRITEPHLAYQFLDLAGRIS